jgi:hypothetical protein
MLAVLTTLLLTVTLAVREAHAQQGIFDASKTFTITQRLRDAGLGQTFYNYSDSIHSVDRYVAVGTVSGNGYRGLCRIYRDAGDGLKLVATVTDPNGKLGDGFGKRVYLFRRATVPHVAVSAVNKGGDGAVLVFRRVDESYWPLQEELTPPTGTGSYATNFGRHIFYDGTSVIVSAESRYKHSKRFVISSTNVKGTSYFEESTGTEATSGDPIFTFKARDGRRNSTRLTLLQTIRGADYTFDFGASVALSPDLSTLAVGAVSRREARFGYGTDGDLVVSGVKLLDGTAEYNFNNVEIMPGGVLTTDNYETLRGAGGILRLRIQGTLKIHTGGAIDMSAHGFKGAATQYADSRKENGYGPGAGKTATSAYVDALSCNHDNSGIAVLTTAAAQAKTSRNASSAIAFAEANGGGGGYATRGDRGVIVQCGDSGVGGGIYGDAELASLQRGSGGGAGFPWKIGSGGAGGDGGGAIWIAARRVVNDGQIVCDGGRGVDGGFYSGGGGGGSGGSVYITGIHLENNGFIYARGGAGGIRATSSGSSGDPDVHGGHGGNGRIRLEFLTTVTSGIVVPRPRNGTAFDGDIWLYTRSITTGLYAFKTKLPRLKAMRFTGHAVAIHGSKIAVASDDRSLANPVQSVFLMDFSSVKNSSSPIYRSREIRPPQKGDLQFGWQLALFNDTILIGAAGEWYLSRGALYMLTGRNLFSYTTQLRTFQASHPSPGDYYASLWRYEYPTLYIQNPLGQDDGFTDASNRLSQGNIQVWKHVRNVSTTLSTVTCEYSVATANTSVLCTITARDAKGQLVGDVNDVPLFRAPTNEIRYVHTGKYQFNVTARGFGSLQVWVSHHGVRLSTTTIVVTKAITPELANFTCTPLNPTAGADVTCTIQTYSGTGEASAARYFHVVVYHANDVTLRAVAEDKLTPFGVYRTPPSGFIVDNVLSTDFPIVQPVVSYVRKGYYRFTYKTWRPGPHAAFAQYQNEALDFPNPVIVDAGEPIISASASIINCPAISAPNRTVICTLTLRSALGVPTDRSNLALNFSSAGRYIRARVNTRSRQRGSNRTLAISSLWAQEGRISLLVYPTEEGQLVFSGEYNGVKIPMNPTAGVRISNVFDTTCVKMSSVLQSFTVMNQHAMGKGDASVYGTAATVAAYVSSKGMCDTGRV